MSEVQGCLICGSTKLLRTCGICQRKVCKNCVHHIDTNEFSFLERTPDFLKLNDYCPDCWDEKVAPVKQRYDETMERASDIYFLTKNYPGHIRVLRRHTKRVVVKECADRRETILRMAFWAAELNFNAIIEAEVDSAKTRMGGYQSSIWSGSAMPAQVDGEQLERSSIKRI